MFKKTTIVSVILATISTFANAAPYVAADLGITDNLINSAEYRGYTGRLALGYGTTFYQDFYLGGEVFGNLFTITDFGTSALRTTYGYGASFIPGYMLSAHTLAYLRLGVVGTRFSNLNSTVAGAQAGLGLQTSLTQNWDLRGEYVYTNYRKVSGLSPMADQVNFGVVYKIQ